MSEQPTRLTPELELAARAWEQIHQPAFLGRVLAEVDALRADLAAITVYEGPLCHTTHHAGCACHEFVHRQELAAVQAKRHEAEVHAEMAEREQASVTHWYARRWSRLLELVRGTDLEVPACNIMANGTASETETPRDYVTRAEQAERERHEARTQLAEAQRQVAWLQQIAIHDGGHTVDCPQVACASADCVPDSGCVDWREKVRRLREALVAAEWPADAIHRGRRRCWVCDAYKDEAKGHDAGCLVGQALQDAEPGTSVPSDLDTFQRDVGEWADRTFPQRDRPTKLAGEGNHLGREYDELGDAWRRGDEWAMAREVADMGLLLLSLAHTLGISLWQQMQAKHQTNQTRQWAAPDAEGVGEHVREQPAEPGATAESLAHRYRTALEEIISIVEGLGLSEDDYGELVLSEYGVERLTDVARTALAAEPSELLTTRYRVALEDIKRDCGAVCEEFETCNHPACRASYAAWQIADTALAGEPGGKGEENC